MKRASVFKTWSFTIPCKMQSTYPKKKKNPDTFDILYLFCVLFYSIIENDVLCSWWIKMPVMISNFSFLDIKQTDWLLTWHTVE